MTDDERDRTEKLGELFEGDWREFAPHMGPPTRWSVSDSAEDSNLLVSVDFSPMKDYTTATFELNGPDFSFSGEVTVEGFAPEGALRELADRFSAQCLGRFWERIDLAP